MMGFTEYNKIKPVCCHTFKLNFKMKLVPSASKFYNSTISGVIDMRPLPASSTYPPLIIDRAAAFCFSCRPFGAKTLSVLLRKVVSVPQTSNVLLRSSSCTADLLRIPSTDSSPGEGGDGGSNVAGGGALWTTARLRIPSTDSGPGDGGDGRIDVTGGGDFLHLFTFVLSTFDGNASDLLGYASSN